MTHSVLAYVILAPALLAFIAFAALGVWVGARALRGKRFRYD